MCLWKMLETVELCKGQERSDRVKGAIGQLVQNVGSAKVGEAWSMLVHGDASCDFNDRSPAGDHLERNIIIRPKQHHEVPVQSAHLLFS